MIAEKREVNQFTIYAAAHMQKGVELYLWKMCMISGIETNCSIYFR